jgi:hypothetical protein
VTEAKLVITLPGGELTVPATVDVFGVPRLDHKAAEQVRHFLRAQYRHPTTEELAPAQRGGVLEFFNGAFWREAYTPAEVLAVPEVAEGLDLTQYRVPIDWSTP